jgi:hypothetical protein
MKVRNAPPSSSEQDDGHYDIHLGKIFGISEMFRFAGYLFKKHFLWNSSTIVQW